MIILMSNYKLLCTLQFISGNQSTSQREEIYSIQFKSSLMQLFQTCPCCGSKAKSSIHEIGTFVRIKQVCLDCNATQVWNSQPFIANVPAHNILLSPSILFTGALPTQALRVFRHLNCATISPKHSTIIRVTTYSLPYHVCMKKQLEPLLQLHSSGP